MAIDYGLKRTGLAITDPLKMIASPLTTVPTKELFPFLKDYCEREDIERFVVGMPKNLQNEDTHSTSYVEKLMTRLKRLYPNVPVSEVDERFTSKIALGALIDGGATKAQRKNKATLDKVSAALILQSWLESNPSI